MWSWTGWWSKGPGRVSAASYSGQAGDWRIGGKCALVVAGRGAQCGGRGRVGVGELRQAGLEQSGVDVGEQHGVMHPGVGDAVAVAAGDAGDQSVRAQPAQVVGHLAGGDLGSAEQLGEQVAQVAVAEPVGQEPEDQQGLQQGLGAAVAQAQPGDAVPVVGGDRVVEGGEGLRGADRVVAESPGAQ